ncbi:MAG: hypothetical protein CM15mP62_02600 [Rhodospirillaceae bacterium]|nr:MAG: hypothetical protein CM15mP62_02600 [Rhodospirillaceae bacterium]
MGSSTYALWAQACSSHRCDTTIKESPETAKTVALLEPGVILRLEKCSGAWCLVEGGSYEGWIGRQSIWGVDAND